MNKEKYFEENILKYHKIFNINKKIETKKDNRLGKKIAGIDIYKYTDTNELFYLVIYNMKQINKLTKKEIVHLIFHELAHAKLKHPENIGNNIFELIDAEYNAEKMALKKVLKYIPSYYNKAVNNLKKYFDNKNCVYRNAFSKLYKEINNESPRL